MAPLQVSPDQPSDREARGGGYLYWLGMPGADGLELLRQLVAYRAHAPSILMAPSEHEAALDPRVCRFGPEPFSLEELAHHFDGVRRLAAPPTVRFEVAAPSVFVWGASASELSCPEVHCCWLACCSPVWFRRSACFRADQASAMPSRSESRA